MRDDFAIFILTHGRADNVITYKTLKKCGNTNRVYLVCDNEDSQLDKYKANFGEENIIVFDKPAKAKECDTMDNIDKRNIVLFARNSCHEIAKKLGLTYFLELDDDYTEFRSRYEKDGKLSSSFVLDMDSIIDATLKFLDTSKATTIAFAQMGDFAGGISHSPIFKERLRRKAMNSFFCRVDKPFEFIGRINEDVNTYVTLGARGELFLTFADIALNQIDTQQNKGGLSESYLELGTYIKSFYTVMACPSCSKITEIGVGHRRIHHWIDWERAVPKIISGDFKKQ